MSETGERTPRYFWSGWFDGQSFGLLATVFAIFSAIDLLATLETMATGVVREGNALADAILVHFGRPGFIVFKIALVLLVIGVTWVVRKPNPRLAHGVLWGGILVMAIVTLRHLAIMGFVATFHR
jgi:hypothetical protein